MSARPSPDTPRTGSLELSEAAKSRRRVSGAPISARRKTVQAHSVLELRTIFSRRAN